VQLRQDAVFAACILGGRAVALNIILTHTQSLPLPDARLPTCKCYCTSVVVDGQCQRRRICCRICAQFQPLLRRAGFFFGVRRGITQWAWNEDHLFNPGNRLFAQEQVCTDLGLQEVQVALHELHSNAASAMRNSQHACGGRAASFTALAPLTDTRASFHACQDLYGRSQKAEKKAKICMHTGTFVYHFKGQFN
jgi:hypothetical protein